jgi:hypothetical protein
MLRTFFNKVQRKSCFVWAQLNFYKYIHSFCTTWWNSVWSTCMYCQFHNKKLILMLCAQYTVFIFSCSDSYDRKPHYLQGFTTTNIVLIVHTISITSSKSSKVKLGCRVPTQILSVFIEPHILATFISITTAKQFYRYLYVGSNYNEFPRQVRSPFWNERWKAVVSANKVSDLADSSSRSSS